MYAEFSDLEIDFWKYDGRLGIAEPCLCMKASAQNIQPLIKATEVLRDNPDIDRLRLTFRKFDRMTSIPTLTLHLAAESDELLEMCIQLESTHADFEFTHFGLRAFQDVLNTWQQGISDFSCHPNVERAKKHRKQSGNAPRDLQSGEVWFWSPQMDP